MFVWCVNFFFIVSFSSSAHAFISIFLSFLYELAYWPWFSVDRFRSKKELISFGYLTLGILPVWSLSTFGSSQICSFPRVSLDLFFSRIPLSSFKSINFFGSDCNLGWHTHSSIAVDAHTRAFLYSFLHISICTDTHTFNLFMYSNRCCVSSFLAVFNGGARKTSLEFRSACNIQGFLQDALPVFSFFFCRRSLLRCRDRLIFPVFFSPVDSVFHVWPTDKIKLDSSPIKRRMAITVAHAYTYIQHITSKRPRR